METFLNILKVVALVCLIIILAPFAILFLVWLFGLLVKLFAGITVTTILIFIIVFFIGYLIFG